MKRLRRILHPTDFSPASRPAFARALAVARDNRAELVIVHVLPSPAPILADGYVSARAYEEIQRSIEAYGKKQLARLLAAARRAGVRARGLAVDGVPHERIVRAARAQRADVVVMGTHGRGGFARLLLGSVAERVIATAPCPVLTVRARR